MTNDEGITKHETRNGEDSFWNEPAGTGVVREEPTTRRVYDLEERTARFGEAIIDFAKTIPPNPVTNRIINQLVGAGTSVGAITGSVPTRSSVCAAKRSSTKNSSTRHCVENVFSGRGNRNRNSGLRAFEHSYRIQHVRPRSRIQQRRPGV